ncbi:hypothetical protein HXX76_011418 [Chlamydomonas incerta]|uniref:C2 domain-containing protein n=1 Tax=Chlamydomonas incerta TaxID=51695 RepID=A0A835VX22_CHLIN|nr:hypothetical protein HXX76_011418 [Chlamydomonas incerta]|eukprot:KAG2428714.1 hypothetical protein HXX76_011418 [Chlamydomonas incerta]
MDLRGGVGLRVGVADASRSPLHDCSSPAIPGSRAHSTTAAFAPPACSPRLHGVGSILSHHSSQWLGADFFLVVHVREARELGPGRSATCDPLVRVSLQRGGGAKSRPLLEAETRVLVRSRNPMWEQSLTFPLDHVGEDMELVLRVRDNDIRHFESFMGQVTLSMWEVLNAVTELGQEICYSMPLYDDSGLGRLRPGTLVFGVAVHAKSTYKELLASRAALQDPSQIQQLLQPYALHLKLQGLRGLAGPAAAPGAGLAVHVGLAGYEASRPLRCAVVGGEADPPDMELTVPLGRALAGVAGLKGKAAARAQFGDVRIELHNSKRRLLAKTQVPLWSVPFQQLHQHHQHLQPEPLAEEGTQAGRQHNPPRPRRQSAEPGLPAAPGGPSTAGAGAGAADAGAAAGIGEAPRIGSSSTGIGGGEGPQATASGNSPGAASAPGVSGSTMSSPFAQAAGAAAAASRPTAAADASAAAGDASTRSNGSSSAASSSEGGGAGSSSSSSDRTSFSSPSTAADGQPDGAGGGGSRGGEPAAAVAGDATAAEAAVAVPDPSYDRQSLDSGLSPPALLTPRGADAKGQAVSSSAAATPAAAAAPAATAPDAPGSRAAGAASGSPAPEAAAPAPEAEPQPLWAGRRYCRRMERVDKSALSGAPTVLVSMQLCPAPPEVAVGLSLLDDELAAAVSAVSAAAAAAVPRSAASVSLASTSGGGWREVLQSDAPYSGPGSGASAAPSHLMSLAGGLTRPLVRGLTTLIGVVAGAGGNDGSGGGAGGNDGGSTSSTGSVTAAAAAAGAPGSAGFRGGSTTGAAAPAPPLEARSTGNATGGTTGGTAATAADSAGAGAAHPHTQPHASTRHMRADVSPAAAAEAAALLASPNVNPLDFDAVDVAEPSLAALLPPLPPLEHVVGDFVVRTGPHELANSLFGHQSPVTAKVANDMGVSAAVVVVGWGPDKEGRAPMARHMTYLTPTPLVGTTPVEHTQRMVTKTDAGFVVENRITPNPLGVGRVVTLTVQVVGRHAGPGKTRLTASLKADWYGSRALYLLKGRVLAACPKESRGYYKQLRAELSKVFGAEDVTPDTEGAASTAATRARVAAATAAAAAPSGGLPPIPSVHSGVAPGFVETADADDAALAAAAALAASGGPAAAASLRTISTRRRGAAAATAAGAATAAAAAADGALSARPGLSAAAGWLLVVAALALLLVAAALASMLWTALGALRAATEELVDSRRQLERAAGLLEAAAAAAQVAAAAVARGSAAAEAALACVAPGE